tara:strand:- start:555 stop:689 length:135 start_codon:yes stop_codon:yes gene_type:complete
MADKLDPGSTFPDLNLRIAGGGTMSLPGDIEMPLAIVLFYRGHW